MGGREWEVGAVSSFIDTMKGRAARNFRELDVYREALSASHQIFLLSSTWRAEERFGLCSQVRRSSRGVVGLIAEGWARRRYQPAFVNAISQALGEATETQAWLDVARECGYIDETTHDSLTSPASGLPGQGDIFPAEESRDAGDELRARIYHEFPASDALGSQGQV